MLGIAYPDSPLTVSHGAGGELRAGDRAPDATVVGFPELATTSLFAQFYAGDPWTLLAFADDAAAEQREQLAQALHQMQQRFPLLAPRLVLTCPLPAGANRPGVPVYLDLDRFAHGAYQVQEPVLFLIRPDGHIGFRSNADNLSPLLEYCTQVFLSPPDSPSQVVSHA